MGTTMNAEVTDGMGGTAVMKVEAKTELEAAIKAQKMFDSHSRSAAHIIYVNDKRFSRNVDTGVMENAEEGY